MVQLLDGSIPFVDTGHDIRNNYNLMAAIKIRNENSIESMSAGTSSIAYQVGKYCIILQCLIILSHNF